MARTRACVGVTTVCAAAVCALGPAAHTLSLARYQPGLAIAHQLARLATCAGAVARTLGDDQVHADNIVFKTFEHRVCTRILDWTQLLPHVDIRHLFHQNESGSNSIKCQ